LAAKVWLGAGRMPCQLILVNDPHVARDILDQIAIVAYSIVNLKLYASIVNSEALKRDTCSTGYIHGVLCIVVIMSEST
jgi:hypothetical protein